jgi:phenylpropionate dioxygenase-like ring-hydroxylating dioxygenase large terminal subunit
MLQTATPMLRRFWYPVIPLSSLAEGPKPFRLLGQDLVIWLDGEGRPAAMDDRCCHRTAKLSKGFYTDGRLACGYHGWEFAADGRVMRVPQRPVDRQGATNMRVPPTAPPHATAMSGSRWRTRCSTSPTSRKRPRASAASTSSTRSGTAPACA